MTGFGQVGDLSLRTVNGRFLEIRLHTPREWGELEAEIRARVQSQVARGTLDLYVNRGKTGSIAPALFEVNIEAAQRYLAAAKELARKTKVQGEVSLAQLLQVPEVLRSVHEETLSAEKKRQILKQLDQALAKLDLERRREGESIRRELKSLLQSLRGVLKKVAMMAESSPEDLRARLKARLERVGAEAGVDEQRFHQELAILIDRGDIREEIARLQEHIKAYAALLDQKDAVGKSLDFYAQELLREVNTIGSKTQNAELTRQVVLAKSIVEKIREQVQNVE
jgi:uncharacterized protein (TIGR00255 family)